MGSNRRKLIENVKGLSEGVLSKAVDFTLVSIYFGLESSLGGYTKVEYAGEKAISDLESFNYSTLKNSIHYLRSRGLVQVAKERSLLPKITDQGKRRLKSVLPEYDDKRVWDGRIYLVTYDIPRTKNTQRNVFRGYIKKIGCGSLQYSVWITPYNPKKLIKEFVDRYNFNGELILISSLGMDGTIGNLNLRELMDKVYNLTDLNGRYSMFINSLRMGIFKSKDQIVFSFLSILKDDPQVPFKLLPDRWVGDKAFTFYKDVVK